MTRFNPTPPSPDVNAFYTELAKSPEDPTARDQVLPEHFNATESALLAVVKR